MLETHHAGSLAGRQRAGKEFLEIAQVIDMNLVTFVGILFPIAGFGLFRPGGALDTEWKL